MKSNNSKLESSVNKLAGQSGTDPRSIKKWLSAEGIEPDESDLYDTARAMAVIKESQSGHEEREEKRDPDTGLTWIVVEKREIALMLRRERLIAEGVDSKEVMRTADVVK